MGRRAAVENCTHRRGEDEKFLRSPNSARAHMGRYISEDPIGLAGGAALFGYVDDPEGWIDPFGLACKKSRYRKRSVAEVAALRKAFDESGGAREKFLKMMAKKPGSLKKFGSDAVERMKAGHVPEDMVVHHKKPLFRGGTNKPSNLELMNKGEHAAENKALHWYEPGDNPYGLN